VISLFKRKSAFLFLSGFLIFALLIPGMLVLSPVTASPDAGDSWTTPVNLTVVDGTALGLAYSQRGLAVDSYGNIHAVYFQRGDAGSTVYEVYYATNAGGSWSWANISHTNLTGVDQYYPVIAVDSNNIVHIVWYGYTTASGDRDLFYCNNAGGTWSAPYNITQNQGTTEDRHPTMVIDSQNTVHIAYRVEGYNKICYVSRNSAGVWSTPVNVTERFDGITEQFAIDVDSSNHVYIVLSAYNTSSANTEVYMVNNSAGSWGPVIDVSQNPSPARDYYPCMDIDRNNNIHVAWEYYDLTNNGLAYKVYNGSAWSTQVFVNTTNYAVGHSSLITDYNGKAHISFTQYDGSDNEIYYVNNTQGSFPTAVNVTADSAVEANSFIALDNQGYAHILFENSTTNTAQYIKSTEAVAPPVPADLLPVIIIGAVVAVVVVIVVAFYFLRIRKPK
jgi:hypothetical protein